MKLFKNKVLIKHLLNDEEKSTFMESKKMKGLTTIVAAITVGILGLIIERLFSVGQADVVGVFLSTVLLIGSFSATAVLEKNITKTMTWITSEMLVAIILMIVKQGFEYSTLVGDSVIAFWFLVVLIPLLSILVLALELLAKSK